MKKIFLFIAVMIFSLSIFGQQIPLHSQYMMDLSMLNPAVVGSYQFSPISFSYRQQWVGFNGAPVTETINAHKYFGKNVGLGFGIFNELTSPSRLTGFQLSFAYHLSLSSDQTKRLSFGLSPVVYQQFIDVTELTPVQQNDPAIVGGINNQFCPDANFGVMFRNENHYYAGISVFNLFQLHRDLFQLMDKINNPVKRTYYFVAGYTYRINDKFLIEPSALVQKQIHTPYQFDVNLKAQYNNIIGLGVSYRYLDAVVYMLFLNINNFRFGYSYDMTTSEIKKYSTGTHEFHLTYRIFNHNNNTNDQPKFPVFY